MIRFRMCPELGDGEHWTLADTPDVLADAVREWARLAVSDGAKAVGDDIRVEVIEMSEAEADSLPEA